MTVTKGNYQLKIPLLWPTSVQNTVFEANSDPRYKGNRNNCHWSTDPTEEQSLSLEAVQRRHPGVSGKRTLRKENDSYISLSEVAASGS